jgi:hypothetical protein
LANVHVELLGQLCDKRVIDSARLARLVVPERRVRSDLDVLGFAVIEKLRLLSRRSLVKLETPIARTFPVSRSFSMAEYVTAGSMSASSKTPSESIGNQLSPDLNALNLLVKFLNCGITLTQASA